MIAHPTWRRWNFIEHYSGARYCTLYLKCCKFNEEKNSAKKMWEKEKVRGSILLCAWSCVNYFQVSLFSKTNYDPNRRVSSWMGSVWIWIRTVRCRSFEVTAPHVAHREFMQQGHSELICIPELTKQRASMQAVCVAAREPCLVMGHRGLGGWRPPRPLSTLNGPFASFLSNLSVKTGCALACSSEVSQILSKCKN